MKNINILGGATIALAICLAAQTTAKADPTIVSVDFQNNYGQTMSGYNGYTGSNANYTGGTSSATDGNNYFVNNWNDSTPPGGDRSGTDSPLQGGIDYTGTSLKTSAGGTSAIDFSIAYLSADNTGNTAANFPKPDGNNAFPFYQNTGNANSVLAGSGIANNGSALTLNLAGLTVGNHYDLIAYVSALYFAKPSSETWHVTGATGTVLPETLTPTANTGLTDWVAADSAGDPANYVEFNGLSTLTGNLSLVGVGVSGDPAIMGFQIVDLGATPEPSTFWMLGMGMTGLAFYLRRKQSLQS